MNLSHRCFGGIAFEAQELAENAPRCGEALQPLPVPLLPRPTLAGMPIRSDKRNIPTVAEGVERYLQHRRVARIKSIRDEISVLQGPRGRVVGKAASGPALAKSELGPIRMDRL